MADDTTMAEQPTEITLSDLPKKLSDFVLKAEAAVDTQNYKYAITLLQTVLKEAPGFVEGRRKLRAAEMALAGPPKKKGLFGGGGGLSVMKLQGQSKKDPVGVMELIEKELEKDPYNAAANDLLFDSALRANMLDTAAFALETVRKGTPDNTKLLHKLAEFYMHRDVPEKAARVYKDICKADPTDTAAVKGEKDATARASMQKSRGASGELLKRDEEETLELEKKSRAALTRDQLEEKCARLVAQYEQDTENVEVVKELATTYENMEDWPLAYQFFEWAHNLAPGDVALRNKAAFMKDKAAEAELKALQKRVEENPNDEEARVELDELQRSRVAEQVEERQKRVDQNPTDPQLRYDLGLALYHAGEYSDAIPHLQQATRNPHIRTRVLLLLGRTFDAKGMHDMAVKQLKDANADLHGMDNTKKEVLYELGLIHEKTGENAEALDCFKQIYEVDYGYRDVAQRVEQSYSA
jgi:tetratricopeptide (TPR) repeat protein